MKFLFLSLFIFLTSCSSSEQGEGEEMAQGDMMEESSDMFIEDEGTFDADAGADDLGMEAEAPMMEEDAPVEEVVSAEDTGTTAMADSGTMATEGTYTVQQGDTLMWVAFRIYGDYTRWRSLLETNPELVSNQNLTAGQTIRYTPPAQPFSWNPQGEPHLVKRGETLGTISMEKYQTPTKWRDIYENNRPMIKDPNLIFAGFTLYYIPLRDLASE